MKLTSSSESFQETNMQFNQTYCCYSLKRLEQAERQNHEYIYAPWICNMFAIKKRGNQ